MRRALVMVASLVLAGCAFEPLGQGGTSTGDDDGDGADADAATTGEIDAPGVTDPDAADPSTIADASLPLPDAILPLPDAALPLPDAAPPPIDAAPPTENACSNGDDDDGDGKTDCRDDDCPSCGGLTSCCGSGACALICL
jgi:hypothetical protein